MISPEKIPTFTGDLVGLRQEIAFLRQAAKAISEHGHAVHTRFQHLDAFYKAPEAQQLFATTQAVQDTSGGFGEKLTSVAGALETYMVEAAEIVKQLETLRARARVFVESVKGHEGGIHSWRSDPDKVAEHKAIWDGVNTAIASFQRAEVTCADKITALVGGTQWHVNNGRADQKNAYGFSAGQLAQADSLPWGRPEHEELLPFGIDYHLRQFGISIGDNAKGSVTGLIDLFSPGDEGSATREGLVRVFVGAEGYLLDPHGDRNTHLGPASDQFMEDSKPYAKEFAKSFVGWDDWSTNPGKAFGTVVFNTLTLGSGPLGALSKVGEAGAVAGRAGGLARVAGTVAKVGEVLDPIGAATRTVGIAARTLPKVSDLVSGVRAATEAATTADKAHSVLRLSDGSHMEISDGQFVHGKHGVTDTTPAPSEGAAADRVPSIKAPGHHELVGAGARAPEAAAHGGESLPPQGSHEGGASHNSTTGHGDGDGAHGSGHDHGSGHHDAGAGHESHHSPAEGSGHSSSEHHHADATSVGGSGAGGTGPGRGPWPVADGVEGPAAGKSLMYPNSRHTVAGAARGEIKKANSVILRGYEQQVNQDLADIAAGKATWKVKLSRYLVNGRLYEVEPTGRVYPDSGTGIAKLDRNEYAALVQISKAKGDISAAPQLTRDPRFTNNPGIVQKALDIYNGTYQP
ncbi:hypothetical protein [Streptomyces alanosinicus]|uniref:Uncharacterized protein n=1 Tax=Streptomyces alanosinicus TaxID=68171 RepID=A0A918YE76_9ACTN|nr:hypothetical protein [Streptomyces alanosinicus]GHE00214.1 hypothetical protein GCM10010339_14410 [Streptomyces alanosinicus]